MSINIIPGMQRSTKQSCWVNHLQKPQLKFGSSNVVFQYKYWDSFLNKRHLSCKQSNIAILWCTFVNLSVSTAVWIFWRESVNQDRGKICIDRPKNKWVLHNLLQTNKLAQSICIHYTCFENMDRFVTL